MLQNIPTLLTPTLSFNTKTQEQKTEQCDYISIRSETELVTIVFGADLQSVLGFGNNIHVWSISIHQKLCWDCGSDDCCSMWSSSLSSRSVFVHCIWTQLTKLHNMPETSLSEIPPSILGYLSEMTALYRVITILVGYTRQAVWRNVCVVLFLLSFCILKQISSTSIQEKNVVLLGDGFTCIEFLAPSKQVLLNRWRNHFH